MLFQLSVNHLSHLKSANYRIITLVFVILSTSSQTAEEIFLSLTVADNECILIKAFCKGQSVTCYRGILKQLFCTWQIENVLVLLVNHIHSSKWLWFLYLWCERDSRKAIRSVPSRDQQIQVYNNTKIVNVTQHWKTLYFSASPITTCCTVPEWRGQCLHFIKKINPWFVLHYASCVMSSPGWSQLYLKTRCTALQGKQKYQSSMQESFPYSTFIECL